MSHQILIPMKMPEEVKSFRLPRALDRRLHDLLDRQSSGLKLTTRERQEAEALVELTQNLSILQMKARLASRHVLKDPKNQNGRKPGVSRKPAKLAPAR